MQNDSNQTLAVKALAVVGILAVLFILILLAVKISESITNWAATATTKPAVWVQNAESAVSSAAQNPSVGGVVSVYQQATSTQAVATNYITPSPAVTSPAVTQPAQNYYVPPPVTTQVTTQTIAQSPAQIGRPDLAVSILATGFVDPTTGAFTATNLITPEERAAVRFQVANIGTAPSGNWQFNAVVRELSQEIFTSPGEPSLNPGDKIVYTISYDDIAPDNNNTSVSTFTVNINPNGSLQDANLGNDIATTQFNIVQN